MHKPSDLSSISRTHAKVGQNQIIYEMDENGVQRVRDIYSEEGTKKLESINRENPVLLMSM